MRDPNGPIPGFEDEYYGTVRHEKKFHQDSFLMTTKLKMVRRQNGDQKRMNGTLYTWLDGHWTPTGTNRRTI